MTRNPGPSSQTRTNVEILTSDNFGDFALSTDGSADISASLAALGSDYHALTFNSSGKPLTWTQYGLPCSATYLADGVSVSTITINGNTETATYNSNGILTDLT